MAIQAFQSEQQENQICPIIFTRAGAVLMDISTWMRQFRLCPIRLPEQYMLTFGQIIHGEPSILDWHTGFPCFELQPGLLHVMQMHSAPLTCRLNASEAAKT